MSDEISNLLKGHSQDMEAVHGQARILMGSERADDARARYRENFTKVHGQNGHLWLEADLKQQDFAPMLYEDIDRLSDAEQQALARDPQARRQTKLATWNSKYASHGHANNGDRQAWVVEHEGQKSGAGLQWWEDPDERRASKKLDGRIKQRMADRRARGWG